MNTNVTEWKRGRGEGYVNLSCAVRERRQIN